ncbi:SDR family oxidoreductase [Enterobacter vonholyi]
MKSTSKYTPDGDGNGALKNAKIFVVGGGSGIGAAIARMAAARGAKVSIAGRSISKLKDVASGLGDSVLGVYVLDIDVQSQVDQALSEFGPYDHIITTAADLTFAPFVTLSDEQINRVLDSKFWGPINIARASVRHLDEQGSVLYFSGVAAYRQSPGTSVVGAVNMALESLVAAFSIELKPRRFNVISSGVVDSPTWAGMSDTERKIFFTQISSGLPVGRVGTVEDEAHAALCVLENGFINGTVINVDGGGRIA